MPKVSEQALEESLRLLSLHAVTKRNRANWVSTYLAAMRMKRMNYPSGIAGSNLAVHDVFAILPDRSDGRINPFINMESPYRWKDVADSGRKTVWNNGTRGNPQTPLFVGGNFANGLLPNALDVLIANLANDPDLPLPHRDALAVFLTRDHVWTAEPTREELLDAASDFIGTTRPEFERLTDDTRLGVPVLGQPEWSQALLAGSDVGPPDDVVVEPEIAEVDDIPVESVEEMPAQFRQFLAQYGISVGSEQELIDLLAATLSSQFIVMAGPSGTGKSLMASVLSAFFAPPDRRCRLDSSRLLAKPEEFFGYYSYLAGNTFVAYDQLLALLAVNTAAGDTPPMVTIEEANLSPIEGYLAPLVHGFGELEARQLGIPLHAQPDEVGSQIPDVAVPPVLNLGPSPRFFLTLNVDAESPAPARKVVSRACVVLLDTPDFETALEAADSLVHPTVAQATGPASALIGRPTLAFSRYAESGSDLYHQAMRRRAILLKDALGVDVIAHRALHKSLMYIAWFVELSGNADAEPADDVVNAAADNALLHFVLPSLPAAQFERALNALGESGPMGVLAQRLARLQGIVAEHQFGPPPDFWGALS